MDESLLNEKVTFVQNHVPALKVGEYAVTVTQQVQINNINITETTKDIPLFTKTFAVIGNRFTLCESEIDSVFPPSNHEGDFSNCLAHIVINRKTFPWEELLDPNNPDIPCVCLITLSESELKTPLQQVTLNELQSPSKSIFFPQLKLEKWEKDSEQCQIIDVPKELLSAIMPTITDLRYLAHAREVNCLNKVTNSTSSTQDFAIVVSNSLPKTGKNFLFLISLIGWHSYLPGVGKIPDQYDFARFVVLKTWSFTNTPSEFHLTQMMKDLGPPACLSMPSQDTGDNKQSPLLSNAFAMGYTLLPHHTRLGDETSSWYRGPLIPYLSNSSNNQQAINCTYTADALLKYDPNIGLFDTSYAAAWQLGRLIGLHNRPYANALFGWKRNLVLQSLYKNSDSNVEIITPDIVIETLSQLSLLMGVPFHYLVADERMLPTESIRFFYLDNNWIKALLNGAYSIGPLTTIYREHTTKRANAVYQEVLANSINRRNRELNIENSSTVAQKNIPITGFLLRSKAINIWPGLEIKGFNCKEQLALLRIEKVATNILLCLFNGEITSVSVQQPTEGIHFGIEPDRKIKNLRTNNELVPIQLPFRSNNTPNVIDVSTLAENIKKTLNYKSFTSAEFALNMVEGVERVVFSVA